MHTFAVEKEVVDIPNWVVDLESFRRWMDLDDYPENGRIDYFKGKVWVDMSKQQVFTHGIVKNEFATRLTALIEAKQLGRYFPDGILVSNEAADLACVPDGSFASWESIDAKRVHLVAGIEGGFVEVRGSPDMVLEVVSHSSVRKDNHLLRGLYWEADIAEYWLVDVRSEPLQFDILRRAARGYLQTRKNGSWVKSQVFGHSFRLTQSTARDGHPAFSLTIKPT